MKLQIGIGSEDEDGVYMEREKKTLVLEILHGSDMAAAATAAARISRAEKLRDRRHLMTRMHGCRNPWHFHVGPESETHAPPPPPTVAVFPHVGSHANTSPHLQVIIGCSNSDNEGFRGRQIIVMHLTLKRRHRYVAVHTVRSVLSVCLCPTTAVITVRVGLDGEFDSSPLARFCFLCASVVAFR